MKTERQVFIVIKKKNKTEENKIIHTSTTQFIFLNKDKVFQSNEHANWRLGVGQKINITRYRHKINKIQKIPHKIVKHFITLK